MNALLHAHSGLRYLVVLVLFVQLVLALVGTVKSQPVGKLHRAVSGAALGLVYTQVLVGLALAALGFFTARHIGHLVPMLLAAVLVTVLHVQNKRAAQPTHRRGLIASGGALALIVVGVAAIGRHLFQMTVGG